MKLDQPHSFSLILMIGIAQLTISGVALAQSPLLTIDGDQNSQSLGENVVGIGDADADGVPDLVAHGPGALPDGFVRAFSGATGAVLWTYAGTPNEPIDLTSTMGLAGDVDGDGVGDVLVGIPYAEDAGGVWVGCVRVLSGVTGNSLQTVSGTAGTVERLGVAVAGLGDLTGDGIPDYAVTAGLDQASRSRTSVTVYSGANQSVLFRRNARQGSSFAFGSALSRAGDLNSDGVEDLLIGDWADTSNAPDSGQVWGISGADGSKLFRFGPTSTGASFGWVVSALGDHDGDGHDDFLVGAPDLSAPYPQFGAVELYSGRDQQLIYRLVGPFASCRLGHHIAEVGDVTGDGFPDFLTNPVAGIQQSGRLIDGRAGVLLWWQFGEASNRHAGAPIGDVDGDGFQDWLLGRPGEDVLPKVNNGRLQIRRGNDLFLYDERRLLGAWESVQLRVRNGSGGALAAVVIVDASGTPAFVPWRFGVLDPAGSWDVAPVTVPPGLAGLTFDFQAFALSATGLIDSDPERIQLY